MEIVGDVWEPIGTRARKFKGNFDGNGKTISGVMKAQSNVEVFGFFGSIYQGSVSNLIMNATVDGSKISSVFSAYIGSVVGKCESSITNCVNKGKVIGPTKATRSIRIAGITGAISKGAIVNCVNEGEIIGGVAIENAS